MKLSSIIGALEGGAPFDAALVAAIEAYWTTERGWGMIPADYLQQAGQLAWLKFAKAFARTAISGFRVGAVLLDAAGNAYLGANMEWPGLPMQLTLHAEQAAVLQFLQSKEAKGIELKKLWVSALPCGHCRQFLSELPQAENLRVSVEGEEPVEMDLSDLLPRAFKMETGVDHLYPFLNYTGTREQVEFKFANGRVIEGHNHESCAYNPSVNAITSALHFHNWSALRGESPTEVRFHSASGGKIGFSSAGLSRELVQAVFPRATWRFDQSTA